MAKKTEAVVSGRHISADGVERPCTNINDCRVASPNGTIQVISEAAALKRDEAVLVPTPLKKTPKKSTSGPVPCGKCNGTGKFRYRTGEQRCYYCVGGKVQDAGPNGAECFTCHGKGEFVDDTKAVTCYTCRGTKKMSPTPLGQERVTVPAYGDYVRADQFSRGETYGVRVEANRPLTAAEQEKLNHLLAYKWRSGVRGEEMEPIGSDSANSMVYNADSTKGSGHLGYFEDDLEQFLTEGSAVRKTDRAGVGTKGTRAVEGFNDPNLKFTLYYED